MASIRRHGPFAILFVGVTLLWLVVFVLLYQNHQRDVSIDKLQGDNAALADGVSVLRSTTSEANRRLKSAGKSPVPVPEVSAAGPQGSDGVPGAAGRDGATGATGARGQTGAQGQAGVSGQDGADGTAGATGATGAQGAQGAQGERGAAGERGATGETGAAGRDAYPFTFTFRVPSALGDTTYTCAVTSPESEVTCTS